MLEVEPVDLAKVRFANRREKKTCAGCKKSMFGDLLRFALGPLLCVEEGEQGTESKDRVVRVRVLDPFLTWLLAQSLFEP